MENTADVEYYTTYPKTPGKKWRETPTSGCAWAHPSIPSGSRDLGSLPVAMILVLLYYYYSKKKARETEKQVRNKSTGEKSTGKKYGKKLRKICAGKKYGGKTEHAQNIFPKKIVREIEKKGGKSPIFRLGMRTPFHPFGDFR